MKVIIKIEASGTFSEERNAQWQSLSDKEKAEEIQISKTAIVDFAMKDMDCSEVDVMIQIVEE